MMWICLHVEANNKLNKFVFFLTYKPVSSYESSFSLSLSLCKRMAVTLGLIHKGGGRGQDGPWVASGVM